jgi:uncharacterized membrane protein affecting hemolysin expression
MTFEFDDKGKFYTDMIKKESVQATIMTVTHKITGEIYVRPDQRIKDELDNDEKFLAVTDATVYSLQGLVIAHCGFLAVQRNQIVWVIPDSKLEG